MQLSIATYRLRGGKNYKAQQVNEPTMITPNPTDRTIVMGSPTTLVGYKTTVTSYRKKQTEKRGEET
jgi:hypothetical protein